MRNLADKQPVFQWVIKTGEYPSVGEAVRNAVRVLHDDARERELLRVELQKGLDEIARGDYIELDDSELDEYMRSRGKREVLRAELKLGVDALERGDFVEFDVRESQRFMEQMLIENRRATR